MKFKSSSNENIGPNHARKISANLMEFAQEIAPANGPPDTFADAVGLARILWNAPLQPEAEQAKSMAEIRTWLAQIGRLDSQFEIMRLLELRRKRYGADRRMVMDYTLKYTATGPQLTVSYLDLDRPENRGK